MKRSVSLQEVMEVVPPCRILMQNGKEVDIVVTERKVLRTPAGEPPPPKKPVIPKEKKKREKRGPAWNRNDQVTANRIGELMSRGLTPREVARELRCSVDTVYMRLRLDRAERNRIAAYGDAAVRGGAE